MKTLRLIAILAAFTLLFMFLTAGSVLAGQTTAASLPRLRGTIKDPSGAAMSAVDVVMIRGSEVVKATLKQLERDALTKVVGLLVPAQRTALLALLRAQQ
jgi:hypothetical protein